MQTHTLTRAEIEAHDPEGGKGGRWLCPLPACADHTDPRRHRNLSLEEHGPKTGLWHCHRCHAQGQLKDLWKPFEPKSRRDRQAEAQKRQSADISRRLEELGKRFKRPLSAGALAALGAPSFATVPPVEAPTPRTSPAPRLSAQELKRAGTLQKLDTPPALAFVQSRGLADFLDLLQSAGVRFASDFGRREATPEKGAWSGTGALVFPLRDDRGALVALNGRVIAPKEGQTKALTFGEKSEGVFWGPGSVEAFQKGGALAICEAPLDALSLAVAGVPSVALCGTHGLPEFLRRGVFGRRFWLAFDADTAGDDQSEALGASLRLLGATVERLRPEGGKDFNELLQTGGEPWTRTAEVLRALIAREAKATTGLGEPLSEAPQMQQGATVLAPRFESVRKLVELDLSDFRQDQSGIFGANSEAAEHDPMERTHPHGAHDPMHVRRPHARGNSATYERPTPHKGAQPHAPSATPCTGGSLEELGAEVETLLCMQSLLIAFENGRVPSSVFPSLQCPSGRTVDNPAVAVRGMLQRSEVLAQGGRIGSKLAGADLQDWPFLAAWWSVGSSKAILADVRRARNGSFWLRS